MAFSVSFTASVTASSAGVGFRDQVGEARAGLARRVAGGAADDLDDLGQAGSVADRQRVFAPDPVEALPSPCPAR